MDSNYIGKICPFCKTEIRESEPIIVCSECGIPHHKGCWQENGGCFTFGCPEGTLDNSEVCQKCGQKLEAHQLFCPICGTQKGDKKTLICQKCGANINEGDKFCSECGQKIGVPVDLKLTDAINQFNNGVQKNKKKKVIMSIIGGAIGLFIIIGIICLVKGSSVKEIKLSKDKIELGIDDSTVVSYTILPEKAENKKVKWESSSPKIASVNQNGKITAKKEGVCTITVKSGNKEDKVIVNVQSGPDFKEIYSVKLGSPYCCEVAEDGSYLSVDTNSFNLDDYYDRDAYDALKKIIEELNLPDSLIVEMGETRSIDGRQNQEFDNVTVSWTYHPDQGLEVMFKIK